MGDGITLLEGREERFLARPRYPEIRLWPEMAKHFVGHNDFEQVHPDFTKQKVKVGEGGFGSFCKEAKPLDCFYIPHRRDPLKYGDKVEIESISSRDAVLELLRYLFLMGLPEAMG